MIFNTCGRLIDRNRRTHKIESKMDQTAGGLPSLSNEELSLLFITYEGYLKCMANEDARKEYLQLQENAAEFNQKLERVKEESEKVKQQEQGLRDNLDEYNQVKSILEKRLKQDNAPNHTLEAFQAMEKSTDKIQKDLDGCDASKEELEHQNRDYDSELKVCQSKLEEVNVSYKVVDRMAKQLELVTLEMQNRICMFTNDTPKPAFKAFAQLYESKGFGVLEYIRRKPVVPNTVPVSVHSISLPTPQQQYPCSRVAGGRSFGPTSSTSSTSITSTSMAEDEFEFKRTIPPPQQPLKKRAKKDDEEQSNRKSVALSTNVHHSPPTSPASSSSSSSSRSTLMSVLDKAAAAEKPSSGRPTFMMSVLADAAAAKIPVVSDATAAAAKIPIVNDVTVEKQVEQVMDAVIDVVVADVGNDKSRTVGKIPNKINRKLPYKPCENTEYVEDIVGSKDTKINKGYDIPGFTMVGKTPKPVFLPVQMMGGGEKLYLRSWVSELDETSRQTITGASTIGHSTNEIKQNRKGCKNKVEEILHKLNKLPREHHSKVYVWIWPLGEHSAATVYYDTVTGQYNSDLDNVKKGIVAKELENEQRRSHWD
jgi:predicted  nucleic acid-binding Zn-ribbon protein